MGRAALAEAVEAATRGFSHHPSRPKPLLQALTFSLIAAAPVRADYQAGLDAYQAGDFDKAMAEWKEEVNTPQTSTNLAVYREALYAIAMLHWQGEGVEQDYTVSAVWLKQAADINHPGAQNKLGYLYSIGQGVPQNDQQARHWFEMAAAQGDPDAVHNLDLMFQRGLFAEQEAVAGDPVQPDPGIGSARDAIMPVEPIAQPDTGVRGIAPEGAGQPVTPGTSLAHGAEWILAQNPEHYTIQVIALRSRQNLDAFIAGHAEWEPFAIYTPAGNERPLWVLVQGVYTDVESARAAADAFPSGLQQREALWIRKFGMVQHMLRDMPQ